MYELLSLFCELLKCLTLGILCFYKYLISPLLPRACRFHVTCSEYAIIVVKQYGLFKGIWLSIKRLSRCHPFALIREED